MGKPLKHEEPKDKNTQFLYTNRFGNISSNQRRMLSHCCHKIPKCSLVLAVAGKMFVIGRVSLQHG